MALTIQKVQGSRIMLGPDLQEDSVLLIPGTSDYPTQGSGGYPITPIMVGFKKVQQAWVTAANPAALGYVPFVNFYIQQLGFSASPGMGESGYPTGVASGFPSGWTASTAFGFILQVSTTGAPEPLVEVTTGYNFSGCIWQVTIRGF
jgi:hypothetical protein